MYLSKTLFNSLLNIEKKYHELNHQLEDPTLDFKKAHEINKLIKENKPIVDSFAMYQKLTDEIKQSLEIINDNSSDSELIALANSELNKNKNALEKLVPKLKVLLLPKDPNDQKNVIVEIRPAAGGNEASIFVANLFELYRKYADLNG